MSVELKQVFLSLADRYDNPGTKDSEINHYITLYCLTKGSAGKRINVIPRETRLTWIRVHRELKKDGRGNEALMLARRNYKRRGPKPVFTPEVREVSHVSCPSHGCTKLLSAYQTLIPAHTLSHPNP